MSSVRKKGGKRKIPVLAQDQMPIYELSNSEDLSDLDSSLALEMIEPLQPTSTLLSSEGLLPLLKKRATIPLGNEDAESKSAIFSAPAITENDDEDDGSFNEDVALLLGSISTSGGFSQDKIRARMDLAKERLRLAFPLLTPQQKERYEKFRQSAIPRPVIKRWMQSVLGTSINPNMVIIAAGMSKVFVGELVEGALSVAAEWKENNGPILPSHIRESYRRMLNDPGNLNPNSFVRSTRRWAAHF